ncbi:MAG: PIN domain-containing protein [Verrucomicrobia bacterium]|nr:PIN domain-containing protein [Verrucomicrobiota bacterium]
MATVIVDAGPLLALFDRSCKDHAWVVGQMKLLSQPLTTTVPVLTEVLFLFQREDIDPDLLFGLFEREVLRCELDFESEWQSLRQLVQRYRSVPASLADASLIRLSELLDDSLVFTLDRDFLIYRRNRRQRIPLLAPFAAD